MDNTPRYGNGWVDMSSQMIIQYNNLAFMCGKLGLKEKEQQFRAEAKLIADRINKYCWNEEDGLYYDVDSHGNQVKFKTVACFWPMLAGTASEDQCRRLVVNLTDTSTFWRKIVFPSLAADEKDYNPMGGYWLGGVWAPTNYAIIEGLEAYGYHELARKASYNYIDGIYRVYDSTGTFWENYMPDYYIPPQRSKPDFVGWTGIGPIALLIENVLGFNVNAVDRTLIWRITRMDEHGIENLRMGENIVSAVCGTRTKNDPLELAVSTKEDLKLILIYNGKEVELDLEAGKHSLRIKN
jgi:neutral trehalase